MTPEGKVKEEVKKVLHEFGLIRAGSKTNHWPDKPLGWYYMPVQNGMGVHGIPDFICCYRRIFVAVETKAPGEANKATPNQVNRQTEILAGGGISIITDDPEVVRGVLGVINYHASSPKS